MPFFSVVIPLYNKEGFISNTLKSVLKQSFQDFEVVIVNDGSTDNSLDEIKKIKSKKIFIYQQKNKGLSATRNKGISLAKGKVIALLDADDLWNPRYLESIYYLYNKFKEVSFYATDYIFKYRTFEVEPIKNISSELKNNKFLIEDFFKTSCSEPILSQSNFAFKRNTFDFYEIYNQDLTFGEDIDFYLRYLRNNTIAYHYSPLVKINCDIKHQITKQDISNLNPPNLNDEKYTNFKNSSYNKYLDIQRYVIALKYKLSGDFKTMNEVLKNVNLENYNLKQLIMIKSPLVLTQILRTFKTFFLRKGIKLSSFTRSI